VYFVLVLISLLFPLNPLFLLIRLCASLSP